jgi:hypothetical protein
MKITKTQLKQIIKEELSSVLENVPNPEFRARAQPAHSFEHAAAEEKCKRIKAHYDEWKEKNPRGYGFDGEQLEMWVKSVKKDHPGCLPDDA